MAWDPTDEPLTLQEIIRAVQDYRQTATLFNYRGDDDSLTELRRFFRKQNVRLKERRTPNGDPHDFVVLHRGDEFIAADRFDRLYDAVTGQGKVSDPDSIETMAYPEVLSRIDHTLFEGYDKNTMVGIARGVEQFAWRIADGEIHTSFQKLSRYRTQAKIYHSLVDRGIEVHLYGAPVTGAEPEIDHPGIITHPSTAEEITRSWFVVFDRPGGQRRGLLAWERVPDDFYGFWTTHDGPIDAILTRIRSRYHEGPPEE